MKIKLLSLLLWVVKKQAHKINARDHVRIFLAPKNICPFVVVTESPMEMIVWPKPPVLNHGQRGVAMKINFF